MGFLDYTLLSEKQYEWDLVYQQALKKNANLARIRILLSNVNDAVAIAKNQLLPELNFTVSYRKAESKNQLNNSYDAPLDNFYTGLEFRLPLNQKPEKARVKEAILNAQSLNINRQQVEQNLLFISREKFF